MAQQPMAGRIARTLLLTAALTGLGASLFPSQAQPPTANPLQAASGNTDSVPADPDPAAPEEETRPAVPLTRYEYSQLFSIGLPDGWQVTEQTMAPQAVILGPSEASPASPIRTEITWYDIPPNQIVSEGIQTLAAEGFQVADYQMVTIDNYTGIQILLRDLPDDLPNGLLTYIGYDDATAKIISYYGDADRSAKSLLEAVHESFHRNR